MGGWKPVMAGIKKIAEHAVKVEINEAGSLVQQERLIEQHFLKWDQPLLKLGEQFLFLKPPLIQAAVAKFPLFVTKKTHAIPGGDHLLPVNIVEPETDPFDLVFDVPPKNGLH